MKWINPKDITQDEFDKLTGDDLMKMSYRELQILETRFGDKQIPLSMRGEVMGGMYQMAREGMKMV